MACVACWPMFVGSCAFCVVCYFCFCSWCVGLLFVSVLLFVMVTYCLLGGAVCCDVFVVVCCVVFDSCGLFSGCMVLGVACSRLLVLCR